MGSWWWLACLCLAALADRTQSNYMSCERVRKELQLQQIDVTTGVLSTPGPGADLQVCVGHSLTCCTRKVEERYQTAVRQDMQNLLQTFSYNLKLLITQNIAALQDTLNLVVHEVQNQTISLLNVLFGDLASRASSPVAELFTDVSLFVLGAELNLEEAAERFFYAIFPLVFEQLELGITPSDPVYQECVRSVGHHAAAYGNAPTHLALLVMRASLAERMFQQSLHLAVEVINTTDHVQPSRDCRRALMRMRYCPLCQDLTDSKPCMGYCLNVLRGCLASLAEVDAHWQEFVRSLEALATRMHGGNELEHALASVPPFITNAVAYAKRNAARITAQVHGKCGDPVRASPVQQVGTSSTLHLQTPERNTEDTLSHKRTEFLSSLRHYRAFYGGLADQMCVRELATTDGPTCWNGHDVAKSYTKRVVGSGIRAQAQNPEVRVKDADPVVNQVIDKLKHINQLLQGRFIPKLGTLDQIEMGSGDTDMEFSGQCDDEDGCWGSGDGDGETRMDKTPDLSEQKPDKDLHRGSHTRAAGHTLQSSGCRNTPGAMLLVYAVYTLLMLRR